MNQTLDEFLKLSDELFAGLRELKGIDEKNFSALMERLGDLNIQLKDQSTLPKELAGVLIDLSTAIYSAADAYPPQQRAGFLPKLDLLSDKMRDLCN
jgi:hypothetical protein